MIQCEGGGGCGGGGSGGRRSLSLWDHMSAVENTSRDIPLAGLTLDAIITAEKRATSAMAPSPSRSPSPSPAHVGRTLLDIIRDEEPHGSLFGHKDKKSWRVFRDRLRLKRAGAAWTSSVPIPASDIPIHTSTSSNVRFNNSRSLMSRRNSVRFTTVSSVTPADTEDSNADTSSSVSSSRPQMTRRSSTRYSSTPAIPSDSPQSEEANTHAVVDMPPARSFRPQMSRHNSTRIPATNLEMAEECEEEPAREGTRRLAAVLAEERALSAREAVAAQEAAEAEAAAQAAAEAAEEEETAETGNEASTEVQPVRMSLMDLLEETDRQMGLVGSRYSMGEEEECEEEEEEEAEEGVGGVEHTCCVCMVRHKGAAFIPCGHTFCRLCSRELWVQRGNCPLCNGFILEILDIF